jgi:hypothetical protein
MARACVSVTLHASIRVLTTTTTAPRDAQGAIGSVMRSLGFVASIACLVLSACGGGGGGGGGGGDSGGTSISASTTSLHFIGHTNQNAPPPQTVTVNFQGAGVVLATLPGHTLPPWLVPSAQSNTATTAVFSFTVFPGSLSPGTHTTIVRFATARADQTNIKFVDVSIALEVRRVASASTQGELTYLEIDGDPAGARATGTSAVRIGGDTGWHATVDQPWVQLGAASGTGARDLTVSVNRGTLPLGRHSATVTVTSDLFGAVYSFPVTYDIRAPRLVASVSAVNMSLNAQTSASALARTITISDELSGQVPAKAATWSAAADRPWLELSAPAGSTAPSHALIVQVAARDVNLIESGTHTATITITYLDSAGVTGTLQVPVTLEVRLPVARAVTPYFVTPNVATTLRVRGLDMRPEDLSGLTLNAVPGAAFTRQDATRLTLHLPPLPAGRYELRFANAAGVARSAATVVVGDAPAVGAGIIESANPKRLVFDEQRGRIFAVDRAQFQIETYTWSGSAWVAGAVISVPQVTDAALAPGGEELIVIAQHSISIVDAADPSLPRRVLWQRPPSSSYTPSLMAISINDQGAALIAQSLAPAGISGGSDLLCFDVLRRFFGEAPLAFNSQYESQIARSPGGRFTVTGEFGVSSPNVQVWDSYGAGPTLLGSLVDMEIPGFAPKREVDYAGTRIVENSISVRDLQGNLLGMLDSNFANALESLAILSPDGTRVFKHRPQANAPGSIEVQDLTAVPTPAYPIIGTIPMPVRILEPGTGSTYAIHDLAGLVTPDARFAILAGTERMVVVDVSGF